MMKWHLAVISSAILGVFAAPQLEGAKTSDPDPKELMKRVAATYQQLLTYQVEVETKVESTTDDPPTKTRYTLVSSKPRAMFTDERVFSPINYHVQLGTAGDSVWAFSDTTNRYVLDDIEPASNELTTDLREQHYRLFRRFEDLDGLDVVAVGEGHKTLRQEGRSIACIRIRLGPTSQKDWEEEIWVDSDRYFVRRSVFRKQRVMEVVTTTTQWRIIQVNLGVNPSTFGFVPPRKARVTNHITVP